MMRACLRTVCVGLGVLLLAAGAEAAVIGYDEAQDARDLNPWDQAFEDYVKSLDPTKSGYFLSWDTTSDNYLAPGDYQATGQYWGPENNDAWGNQNPSWLNFNGGGSGGSGGGIAGGGTNTNPGGSFETFSLTVNQDENDPQQWSMDFSVLIFDPNFAGDGVKVTLIGEETDQGDTNTKSATVETGEVVNGKLVTFHVVGHVIEDDQGDKHTEEVDVLIESLGTVSYAAGFFMSDADPGSSAVPEPATMAMLALGVGGMLAARRRRR